MAFEITNKIEVTGEIILVDGRYFREYTYKNKGKEITKIQPVEELFSDFYHEKVRITIERIK